MKLTDWRGVEYGVGSLVVYPRMDGRSVEAREAEVVDIWQVFRNDNWEWERWTGEGPEPKKLETRVKLRPTGRSSRGFMDWSWKPDREQKDVTLTIIKNVTVLEAQ